MPNRGLVGSTAIHRDNMTVMQREPKTMVVQRIDAELRDDGMRLEYSSASHIRAMWDTTVYSLSESEARRMKEAISKVHSGYVAINIALAPEGFLEIFFNKTHIEYNIPGEYERVIWMIVEFVRARKVAAVG